MSRAEVAELDDEGNVMSGEALSVIELCLKKGPSFVYGGVEPPVSNAKEMGSK